MSKASLVNILIKKGKRFQAYKITNKIVYSLYVHRDLKRFNLDVNVEMVTRSKMFNKNLSSFLSLYNLRKQRKGRHVILVPVFSLKYFNTFKILRRILSNSIMDSRKNILSIDKLITLEMRNLFNKKGDTFIKLRNDNINIIKNIPNVKLIK